MECRRSGGLTAHLLERRGAYDVLEFWCDLGFWVKGTRPAAWWDGATVCESPEGPQ